MFDRKPKRMGLFLQKFEDGGEVKPDDALLADRKTVEELKEEDRGVQGGEKTQSDPPQVEATESEGASRTGSFADAFQDFLDKITGEAPYSVKRFLEHKIGKEITDIEVVRVPIQKEVDKVLDIITMGKWIQAKNRIGYDQMFHLFMLINIGGQKYRIEKNQVVKMTSGTKPSGAESISIPLKGSITLPEMMDKAIKKFGSKKIWRYNAFSTNCQAFISHLLSAVGLLTGKAKAFIYQPVDKLVKELPGYTGEAAKKVTDTAAVFDRIIQWFTRGAIKLRRGGRVYRVSRAADEGPYSRGGEPRSPFTD